MMATLFPTRKRKELKSKFKYEEKNHPELIEIALKASAAPLGTSRADSPRRLVEALSTDLHFASNRCRDCGRDLPDGRQGDQEARREAPQAR
jgi:hypothetical protein